MDRPIKYTLRQLQVFLATARHENVSKAAAALSMSQSAASGALKELESQYDVQLFDRVGKRLQLNEMGRLLRPRAESLLAEAEDFARLLEQQRDVGIIRVGATLTIGNYLAVNMVARYMSEKAGAEATLEVGNTSEISEKLRNFELDVGLIEGEVHDPELELLPWQSDRLQVFCAPDDPLASKGSLDDGDLVTAQWIVRESGSGTRQAFDRAMHGIVPQLQILLELQHTEAIKRAVESGLGIACLSSIALEDAFAAGRFVPLEVPGRDFQRQLYVAINRHKYRSESIERWLQLCQRMSSS